MKKYTTLFLTGGTIYPLLEIACRGKTDISMGFAGGICLCLINHVCNSRMKNSPIATKCLAGSFIITTVEFAVGILVNVVFKMDVWDYSGLPMNVMGQICIPFSILWFFMTLPAMGICALFERTRLFSK